MATGAANMATLARQLEKLPDQAVAELVRWFVPRSEQIGGVMTFKGRRYQLSSRIRTRKGGRVGRAATGGATGAVVVVGTPAGGWSIKSYGRRGGYDVKPRRRQALSLSAYIADGVFASAHIGRGTTGDRRWDRLVEEANVKFPDVVASLIDRKVII